ncbi:glycine cleavage system H protein [Marinicella pacifica]|jgi:glycine cleavage system H protein|uniref:Glycine cleavage system H protein n=1 Tax=Marinicella pacifica TaxID=1171543 RepID=A0A917FQU0_9GAMM|nr:glycine cleavage system protein GcvH [Marinicella pacifica]GGF96560.1 glycine cleavage system H protein [Marinicella pacifica]
MSYVPDNLSYTASHEWLEKIETGRYRVGITEFAQDQLGDIVFVELPEMDESYAQEDECGVVESVKTASDLYAPIGGTIVEINDALEDTPELINDSPYDDGWIFVIEVDDESDLDNLLSAEDYRNSIEDEE